MNQANIGKFIAICRKEKNLTQEQLAEKLGVTNKSVSRWENGKTMPDYSILNSLCRELNVTVNELLSGERIKRENYENKAQENLDNILKEYYKMKKQKKTIKNILIVVVILFISFIVKISFFLGISLLTFFLPPENISGVENYNKNYYIEKYSGDLDSDLSIFPDDISSAIDSDFISSFQTNLFGSDGYIILKAKYNKENFENEIKRISNLEKNIVLDNSSYTNKVKYSETYYNYPAYITIDGFGNKYEYCLINEGEFELIYIYLSYPDILSSAYSNYLKVEKQDYFKQNTLDNYSMYNHTFDNGESYIEFDDYE